MNKVSRLLGSATLATGLIFGGSTGVAFANDNDKDRKGSSHSREYTNDNNRDRERGHDDRRNDRRNSGYHNNDYKYLYHCHGRWGHDWYEWGKKHDDKRNCHIVYIRY
jgi:hypothetical protein